MTYKEAQENYRRIQEKKSNLSESDSAWLKEVETYPIDERFDTETGKMALLSEIFNNNLFLFSQINQIQGIHTMPLSCCIRVLELIPPIFPLALPSSQYPAPVVFPLFCHNKHRLSIMWDRAAGI